MKKELRVMEKWGKEKNVRRVIFCFICIYLQSKITRKWKYKKRQSSYNFKTLRVTCKLQPWLQKSKNQGERLKKSYHYMKNKLNKYNLTSKTIIVM